MIPRRIGQFWDVSPPPPEVDRLSRTWRSRNPGYLHTLYDDGEARGLIRGHFGGEMLSAYDACRIPALKSDLFRYAMLFVYGGFYVDADEACVGRLDGFADLKADFVGYRKPNGYIANDFLGCPRASPIMRQSLRSTVDNITRRISYNVWEVSGPPVLTRAVEDHGQDRRIIVVDGARYATLATIVDDLDYKTQGGHWADRQQIESIFQEGRHASYRNTGLRDRICGLPVPRAFDRARFVETGEQDFRKIRQALRRLGIYLVRCRDLLECGTDYGRITRRFLPNANTIGVHSVDFSKDSIDWAQRHLSFGTYHQIHRGGALPFPDGRFDLAYWPAGALGPMTPDQAGSLLLEIGRVLRRDGVLLLTGEHPTELRAAPSLGGLDPLPDTGLRDLRITALRKGPP